MNLIKEPLRWLHRLAERKLGGRNLGRFALLEKIRIQFVHLLKSDIAIVGPHRMVVDPSDSLRLSINGIYEELETRTVEKLVRPGDVVFDVGANIGYYTLLFARLAGPTGQVVAFEPVPLNLKLLNENVRMNGYSNIKVIPCAVSDHKGKVSFEVNEQHPAGSRLVAGESNHGARIEVDAITLDEHLSTMGSTVNFIKMDCEGAEFLVFRGMKRILAESKRLVIMAEFAPNFIVDLGAKPEEFVDLVTSNGFKIYDMERSTRSFHPITPAELFKRYTPALKNHANLILTKGVDQLY